MMRLMTVDASVIGRPTTLYRVVIEQGPVTNFATAVADRSDSDPVGEIIGGLMAEGGLVLHGEQSFEYHRPLVVGDVLRVEGRVADLYEKHRKGKVMTFLVVESTWTDETTGDLVLTERMNLIHRA